MWLYIRNNYRTIWIEILVLLKSKYPFLLFSIFFFIGQIVGFIPGPHYLLFLELSLFILIIFLKIKAIHKEILIAFLIGVISSQIFYQALNQVYNSEVSFLGEVQGEIKSPIAGQLTFTVLTKSNLLDTLPSGTALRCRAVTLPGRNADNLKTGDVRWFKAKISGFESHWYGWGFEAYQKRLGLSGDCKVQYISEVILNADTQQINFERIISDRLGYFLGDDETVGLMRASLLGVHDTLSSKTEMAFKHAGLTHLVVVSGYQVGIIFSLVYWFFNRITRHRILASTLGIIVALCYSKLIGLEYTVLRASVAISVFVIAQELERDRRILNPLLLALLAVSSIWPCSILDLSVQLTFAALAALACGAQISRNQSTILRYLTITMLASICPSIVLALWGVEFGPWGLVLNPIFAPIFSIASVPMVLVGLACSEVYEPLSYIILKITYGILWSIKEISLLIDHEYQLVFILDPFLRIVLGIIISLVLLFLVARATWRLYVTRGVLT